MRPHLHYVVYLGHSSHGPTAFVRTISPLEVGATLEHQGRTWRIDRLADADLGLDAVAYASRDRV